MIRWWFQNRNTGELTIAQPPNPPMVVFVVAWVLRWLLSPAGTAGRTLGLVAGAAILWWGVDEVLRGVNPWRRVLGLIVLSVLGWRLVR